MDLRCPRIENDGLKDPWELNRKLSMCQITFKCMSWYSHCHHVWSNSQTNKPVCNKQTNINLKLKQLKTISQVVTTMAKQWHCGKELVAVQTMRSNHLTKPRLLLYFLLVNTCFSETTIQPTQKDGCPLFLVHGGSGWRLPIFSSTLSSLLSLKLLLPGGSDIFLVSTRCVPAVRRLNILIILRYQAGDTGWKRDLSYRGR